MLLITIIVVNGIRFDLIMGDLQLSLTVNGFVEFLLQFECFPLMKTLLTTRDLFDWDYLHFRVSKWLYSPSMEDSTFS